nr:MAG TPA: hypothetical protein [Caudoviricetes sp.]
MGGDSFASAVDRLRVALEDLEETWVTLQKCEDLTYGDPFIDEVWNDYVAARIVAENAFADLAKELTGLYIFARITNVHGNGVE